MKIKNERCATIKSVISQKTRQPFFAFRSHTLAKAQRFFADYFTGRCLYAVKTNPDQTVLTQLYRHGLTSFEVASIEEVSFVRGLFPDATIFFMHPIKPRYAIREAYEQHNVRHFAFDSASELQKIYEETDGAKDLCLHMRLAIPNTFAELALSGKFGVSVQEAPVLLHQAKQYSEKLGICFHVGSQCMHPDAYREAIQIASQVIEQSGVLPHYFNVGGGFPSIYPGLTPPHLHYYFDAIAEEFAQIEGHESMTLLAEPGRAMVAESMSLVVRVDLRKRKHLYINDGTYGSLFDAGTPKFIFPVSRVGDAEPHAVDLEAFSFYGPTCDSLDYMPGPFYLPHDIEEGDYIEIGQMGAYARSMTTQFNGFTVAKDLVHVSDEPLMTMYEEIEEHLIAA